ncbi:hypothetical protein MIR68_012327 [Amoeboaphelidium protococcarum]|nr:hypothetical protein MIR68_012327 [Amoeboaphelidium protococcarum]
MLINSSLKRISGIQFSVGRFSAMKRMISFGTSGVAQKDDALNNNKESSSTNANTSTDEELDDKPKFEHNLIIPDSYLKSRPAIEVPNVRARFREQICKTPVLFTSTKKLNLLADLIKGMDVEQAILQLIFTPKGYTAEILWALREGCRIIQDVQRADPKQFYVAFAYTERGPYTKSVQIKGRGRMGIARHPQSQMVIMLRGKAFKEEMAKNKSGNARAEPPRPDRPIINARIQI